LIKGKEGKMADTFLTRLTGNNSSSNDNHGLIEQLKKDILYKLYLKKVAILVYAKLNGSTFIELK